MNILVIGKHDGLVEAFRGQRNAVVSNFIPKEGSNPREDRVHNRYALKNLYWATEMPPSIIVVPYGEDSSIQIQDTIEVAAELATRDQCELHFLVTPGIPLDDEAQLMAENALISQVFQTAVYRNCQYKHRPQAVASLITGRTGMGWFGRFQVVDEGDKLQVEPISQRKRQ